MPDLKHPHLDLADLTLTGPQGHPMPLRQLTGVNVLVMLRHRH
ncbi:hypothetical protein [Segeticoccus rhizosphaerae]|nr:MULTISPECIES: hypothetical protein [Intrasporangiaceae]